MPTSWVSSATSNLQVRIVAATTLSNFIDADLEAALALDPQQPLRIGLMGVWTEAKITFLAYDLRIRYPLAQLAVCSALTASSSRHNHFLALDQMERLLGVRVFASIGDFVAFLGGAVEAAPLSTFAQKHPELEVRDATELSGVDQQLLRYLFRGCRKLSVRSLDGGFSGNRALATQSIDVHGHEQVPHVVKIGAQGPIGQERTAFERIEAVLGNAAPRIADFADWQARGAIKYRCAAMGSSDSQSFQKIYAAGTPRPACGAFSTPCSSSSWGVCTKPPSPSAAICSRNAAHCRSAGHCTPLATPLRN
jgi:Ternary complex associated domain 9